MPSGGASGHAQRAPFLKGHCVLCHSAPGLLWGGVAPPSGAGCPAPQVPVRGPSPEAGLPTGLLSDAKGICRGFTFLFFSFASLIFSSEVQINSPNSYSEPAFLGWTWGTQKSHHTGQWCFRTTLGKYMHHEASSTKEVISLPGGLEAGSCQGA